ncbi:SHOCT domain-containing protein [Mycobacterium sp. 852002-10029_SCH5224772]|uniref:SHOCT domain-containing protein n=1 Tax=Mycobacterium sp. 852002-10029_SCH5224772 TaxID=1834083 RepID=UPI0012E8D28F|nr:SHOCT domain-containing protein [Mycobacterium sp. 852002-10029_SCH5224772]
MEEVTEFLSGIARFMALAKLSRTQVNTAAQDGISPRPAKTSKMENKLSNKPHAPINHKFGPFTVLTEYPDGTAEYLKGLTTHFRVRIADVRGFSVTKGAKWAQRDLNVLGQGTVIATVVDCSDVMCNKIEEWFRNHPQFYTNAPTASSSSTSVADELRKLADLRTEGILTEAEFQEEKARLLRR